jgi:hypothetical protein
MRQKNQADTKREQQRNDLWPGSGGWIWDPSDTANVVGFATMTRLMPWILSLIRHLSGKGKDPTGVYLELWCRDRGQGIISINDEQEHAYAAGYMSTRAVRTWREHVQLLVDLHFLKVERSGNREVGFVLLLNPLAVAHWYHLQGRTPDGWWVSFTQYAREIKSPMPPPLGPAETAPPKVRPTVADPNNFSESASH